MKNQDDEVGLVGKIIAIVFLIVAGVVVFMNLFMNDKVHPIIPSIIIVGFVLIGLFRFIYNYKNSSPKNSKEKNK